MYSLQNNKFSKTEIILHPGEFYSSSEDLIISTILGSCVSVVLFDEERKQGGLNHFLLPGIGHKINEENISLEKNARYGVNAMEVLINALMKQGSDKGSLTAKVFGGASMFSKISEIGVGQTNTDFASAYLKNEGIRIAASDTGGNAGRKIYFFPSTGRILMKKIRSREQILDINMNDRNLEDSILKKPARGNIVLF